MEFMTFMAFCVVILTGMYKNAVTQETSNIEPNIVYLTESSTDIYEDRRTVDVIALNISIDISVKTLDVSQYTTFNLHKKLCHLVTNGTVAFVADVSCGSLRTLSSAAVAMEVPLINISPDCGEEIDVANYMYDETYPTSGSVLNYFQPKSEFKYILADTMHMLDWKNIIVIYDENSGYYLNDINSILIEQNITGQSFKVQDLETDVANILDYVNDQKGIITRFILACGSECMKEVLLQANDYDKIHNVQGLFTYESQWLLISPDRNEIELLEDSIRGLDHVTALTSADYHHSSNIKLLREIVELLLTTMAMYNDNVNNLKMKEGTSCGEKYSITRNVQTAFQDFFSDELCSNCTEYIVAAAVYVPGEERKFQVVGEWTQEEYKIYNHIFPNLAFGFNGRFFKSSTMVWDPFVIASSNSSTGFEGLCMALLDELAMNLNFTYNLSMPADGEWGIVDNVTGKWTGLVGVLQDKVVDMVVAPLGNNVDREKVMDFSEAYFLEYQAVLIRYKNSESEKWKLYLEPFQWQSWISFIAAIPLGAFTIWLVTILSPYYKCHGPDSEKKAKEGLGRIENAMFFSFGAFFQQGSTWMPDSQSGRFIVGFWWMYCIVVMATYSGNLIAYLTVTKTTLPFDSLDDMINQNKFKFGTLGGTITEYKLQIAKAGQDKALWDKISKWAEEDPTILGKSHSDHIQRTLEENYAYIQDRTSFELETSKRCDIGIVNELFQPLEYAIALQNNSFFEKRISLEVIKIRETGLLNKWKVEWWPRKSFCNTGTQTIAKAVSLIDVQGAYYVMGMLLCLACISLVGEGILHLINPRKKSAEHSGSYLENGKKMDQNDKDDGVSPQRGIDKNVFDTLQTQIRSDEYGGKQQYGSLLDYGGKLEYGGMFDNSSKYNP